MLLRDAPGRDIVQPADDPAHRILVLFEGPCGPAQLDFSVAEKIRHELPERRLTLGICSERTGYRLRRDRDDGPGRNIRKHKTATPKRIDRCMLVVALK